MEFGSGGRLENAVGFAVDISDPCSSTEAGVVVEVGSRKVGKSPLTVKSRKNKPERIQRVSNSFEMSDEVITYLRMEYNR